MLKPEQEWLNEASRIFKTNNMSSTYMTSMVEANGRQKVVSGPHDGWGEKDLLLADSLEGGRF